ncbi:caspase family protein [Desulfobacterales bacterium HSG2]|nr:caspase family protein [Desulfobacterales bacterium HSG2]
MMKKILVLYLILLLFAGPAIGAGGWRDILRQKRVCHDCEKKALVIGVGDYLNSDSKLKDLRGPKSDIVLIQEELLKPVLGYESDEILVLADHEATKPNIRGIMENWFLKGEAVEERFFYFSGHGSQISDRNGDEQDNRDEVLLTHDAEFNPKRSLKPETVLIDDDLRLWFEKLRGKKLLAMLDSCHSGSGFRSIGQFSDFSVAVPRYVQSRGRFGQQHHPGTVKPGPSEDTIPENHVYLYAAQSSQVALERQFETGNYQGCFTSAMIRAAREVCTRAHQGATAEDVSYLKLYTALNNVMKGKMNLEQTPDIQPAFRGTEPERYRGTDSAGLLEPFVTASKDIKVSTRLKSRLPDADRHKISVLITDESGKKLLTSSDLDHTKRYALTDFSKKDKSYHLYVKILRNSVELTNANGFLLNSFPYYDKAKLAAGIRKRIQHAFLKDLLDQIESEHGFPMSVKVESNGRVYDKNDFYGGQQVTYIIESEVDAYVYVLAVDAGGELNLYLPFEYQKNNKIAKGGKIRILDPKQCGDDFVLEISNEPGEEILKIVASPTPLRIRMAQERGDYLSKLTFDEALKNIKDMIAQLKKSDIWYEGTRKYMNHSKSDYDRKFRE